MGLNSQRIHYYGINLLTLLKRIHGQTVARCYHKLGLWHIEVRGAGNNENVWLRSKTGR